MSRRGVVKRFGIALSTTIRWVHAWRRTGSYRPRAQGGDRRSQRIKARAEAVLALVDETPDMTLAGIAVRLENKHGLRVSQSAVWRFFHRRGITFKKTAHAGAPGSRHNPLSNPRSSSSSMRQGLPSRWHDAQAGLSADIACRALLPHGHWKTRTFLGALRLSCMTAPMVLDGAMHGAAFLAYVEQVLVPTLKRRAARPVTELWEAIGQAMDNFIAAECQNYFNCCRT